MIAPATSLNLGAICSFDNVSILIFFGFAAMSAGVESSFVLSFNFIIPALSSKINARPPFVGSLGIIKVSPFFKSLIFFIFLEYNAIGSK